MFERCDANTRLIVDAALEESRRRSHRSLGIEHLLVAFARRRDVLPDDVAQLLPDADDVASALAAAAGRGRPDAELLKGVGVDLDEVRSAVRRTFGDEAVQRLRRPVHQPWRRPSRRCTSVLVGEIRVSPRVNRWNGRSSTPSGARRPESTPSRSCWVWSEWKWHYRTGCCAILASSPKNSDGSPSDTSAELVSARSSRDGEARRPDPRLPWRTEPPERSRTWLGSRASLAIQPGSPTKVAAHARPPAEPDAAYELKCVQILR